MMRFSSSRDMVRNLFSRLLLQPEKLLATVSVAFFLLQSASRTHAELLRIGPGHNNLAMYKSFKKCNLQGR